MKQFVKFGIVGAFNTVFNYIIYAICINVGLHYIVANIISFLIVIFFAYLIQNKFVFVAESRPSQTWWRILLKTYASYFLTGVILTNLLSVMWLDLFNLEALLKPFYQASIGIISWKDQYTCAKYMVPFFNAVLIVPLNFLINKYWTYRFT